MRRGYTLIEIIIVVTIIGLLTGASIAGFNTLNQRQTVLSAAKEVISVMRTAQQRANAGILPSAPCDSLAGYSVKGTVNSSAYTLNVICSSGGVREETQVKSYSMASGVTFTSTFDITFNVLTGGAGGSLGDLKVKSSAYTFTFNINAAGDISEKGLQ